MPKRANTQLDRYFSALNSMYEVELTALAETHADDPSSLVSRFLSSVKAVQSRLATDEPFYDGIREDPPGSSNSGDQIKRTIEFAGHLSERRKWFVEGEDALAFRYIDREISPARTLNAQARRSRRSLDLLLANSEDHLPVLAELKIGSDKTAYYALIQLLMLAAEFQSGSQRGRLLTHSGGRGLEWPTDGPFFDLYIIAYEAPNTGKYRARLLRATARICQRLVEDSGISRHIRRIAYLDAMAAPRTISFKKRFAFGVGC